jgi:capsule polysaccharide export protein KpsE/RkpR
VTQKSQQTTPYDLIVNLQKNLISIATELDEIRFHKPSDLNILNLNVGRLQGLAQSLDWYLMQLARSTKSSFVPMGFQIVPPQQQEEEIEEEEEDGDEELRK